MEQNQRDLENQLSKMMWGHYVSGSLRTIADLAIADHLINRTRTADELAKDVGCHARSLYRVMHALATVGIFEQDGDQFSLTPLGNLLRSDIPGSQRLKIIGRCSFFDAWGKLTETVKTGKPPRGDNFYDCLFATEEGAKLFYDYLDSFSHNNPAPMLDNYDFSNAETVMDIGGGSGSQLIAILKRYPHLKGILFELPDAVKLSKANIEAASLTDRCRVVGGNFFDTIPGGADVYMMRHIIHNWNDSDSIKILSNVRAVLPDNGRVLLIEILEGSEDEEFITWWPWWQLAMFVVGGLERTQEEYAELLAKSGLKFNRLFPPTNDDASVIEGIKG